MACIIESFPARSESLSNDRESPCAGKVSVLTNKVSSVYACAVKETDRKRRAKKSIPMNVRPSFFDLSEWEQERLCLLRFENIFISSMLLSK